MRKLATLTLLVFAVALILATTASARRAVYGEQKNEITRVLAIRPQCAHVWISTVRPGGQNWAFERIFGHRGACANDQAGDAAFLHRVNGGWRSLVQGDEFGCDNGAVTQVPLGIQADLVGCL